MASGYALWKSADVRLDPNNPPLAKLLTSFPLLFRDIAVRWDAPERTGAFHYAFGERLLYYGGNDPDAILVPARGAGLVLSCVLAVILWRYARKTWGEGPAALCAVVYCLSPTLLSHACLATTDFPAVFFSVLALLAFSELVRRRTPSLALAVGAASWAAFLCKYSAVLLWPVFALALALELRRDPRGAGRLLRVFAGFALVPWLLGTALFMILFPPALSGLLARLGQFGAGEHPSFLMGSVSKDGFLSYYAVAWLAKSTLAETVLLALAAWTILRDRRKAPIKSWLPLLAFGVYLLAASLSSKQIGVRYVLLAYPMQALLAAAAAAALEGRRWARAALPALGAAQALSAAFCSPHFLAHFNALMGGAPNGHRILVDSNLDWGQELKGLAKLHREHGSPEVVLSYFGTDSAERRGVLAQQVLSHNSIQRRHRNSDSPTAEWLVVSATNLRGVYSSPDVFQWLWDREPIHRVGYGLFVYDITRDAEAHRRLAGIYEALGDKALAARERKRAAGIAEGRKAS